MPRKPLPVFSRLVKLPFGTLELTVEANPLTMNTADRVLFNSVLDQVEVIENVVKSKEGAGDKPAGAPITLTKSDPDTH
jgi:hypothetical protein